MKSLKILKFALSLCLFITVFVFNGLGTESAFKEKLSAESYEASSAVDAIKILDLVNDQRRRKGLEDLFWSRELESLARNYSRKMAEGKFFGHYEKNGDTVVQRAKAMQIKGWRKIGENLFMCGGYKEINSLAVNKWMSSSSHRQNILDERFNTTGIGIYQSRDGAVYITQVFAQY